MRKAIVLVGGLWLVLLGFAEPAIKDRSVLGCWRFESGAYATDSSGYGSDITTDLTGGGFELVSAGSYDGSGCLKVTTAAKKCSATLAKSVNGTSATPYYTMVARFKSDIAVGTDKAIQKIISDTEHWHMLLVRYHNKKFSSKKWTYVCDPDILWEGKLFWNNSNRPEDTENFFGTVAEAPLSVSETTVTIGGNIASSSYKYKGAFDDVMIINRALTKEEMTRLYLTRETYVFPCGTRNETPPYYHAPANVSFDSVAGWSSDEFGNGGWSPGEMPGAAYIVDSGLVLNGPAASATFGGDVSKQVSLTLGRLAPLKNVLTGETLVSNTQGNFSQGAGSAITFYDLRLNDGTYAAGGTSLTTTLLDVDAPASKPFTLAAAGDFALNVGEDTTGSGVLAKTGAGKLTVNKWTGTAKLRLAEGFIKTPRLDGYTSGTVIVDEASVAGGVPTVTFTGTDTLSGTIQVRYDGTIAAAEATYPVLNAPTLTSAGQVAISAAIPEKYEGAPKLENGVVCLVVTKKVAPLPDEDKGAKPVLLWQ